MHAARRFARNAAGSIDCIYWRGLLRCRPTIDRQCEKPQAVERQQIQIPTLFLFPTQRQRGDDRGMHDLNETQKSCEWYSGFDMPAYFSIRVSGQPAVDHWGDNNGLSGSHNPI